VTPTARPLDRNSAQASAPAPKVATSMNSCSACELRAGKFGFSAGERESSLAIGGGFVAPPAALESGHSSIH
jgi:hypothetical protein